MLTCTVHNKDRTLNCKEHNRNSRRVLPMAAEAVAALGTSDADAPLLHQKAMADEENESVPALKRNAVTSAIESEDADAEVDAGTEESGVELEPAALVADTLPAAKDDSAAAAAAKVSSINSSPLVVYSSSQWLEPTRASAASLAATPTIQTTIQEEEVFPMPTSLPPDDLGMIFSH